MKSGALFSVLGATLKNTGIILEDGDQNINGTIEGTGNVFSKEWKFPVVDFKYLKVSFIHSFEFCHVLGNILPAWG